MRTLVELIATHAGSGRLEWIGLSPSRRAALVTPASARVEPGTGLEGDHHATSGRSARQVTLIQFEHLPVVAAILGVPEVDPAAVRRNLAISGINVLTLKDQPFRIGEARFEGTGPCHPCSRMEEALGVGGYNAMRGHGGITARVIQGGVLRVGDVVELEAPSGAKPDPVTERR